MKINFDKINELRKEKGLSILGLCKLAEISRTTLWSWEKNRQRPSESRIIKLAHVLNVSTSVISNLKDNNQISQLDYSDAVDSWQSLVDMNKSHQQDKFNNFISEISSLNNNMNQVKMIIEALTSSMETNFYMKDTQQKYIICSNSFLNTIGLKYNFRIFGKSDADFFSIKEAKANTKQDSKVLAEGKPIRNIEMYIPGSRKKKWGIASKYPVRDNTNNIIGLIGIFIDITDKKKAEEKNDIFLKVLDAIPYVIGLKGDEYLYMNKTIETLSGHSLENIINSGNEHLDSKSNYAPDTKKLKKDEARIGKNIHRNNICRILKSNGDILWIHNTNIHEIINNKKYGIGIARDYTEEQQKEVELASYQRMLEQLSKNSNDIIWGFEFTKNWHLLPYFLNENFEKLTGYSKDDFLYKKPELEASLLYDEKFNKESILSIIHSDYHSGIEKGLLNKTETENFKFEIIAKDEKLISLQTSVSLIDIIGVNISYFGKATLIT